MKKDIFILDDNDGSLDDVYVKTKKKEKSAIQTILTKAGFNPNQERDSFGRFGSGEGESESENVNKCKGLLNKNINASDSEGKRGLVKTKDLIPFIGEDRTGTAEMINSKETIKKLKKDITENGFKEPIMLVYDKFSNGGEASILEGNHRMAAAIELNLLEVPVRFEKGTLRSNESREKDRMFPLNRVFIGKLNDTYGVTANDLGLQVRQPNKEDYNNCNKSAIDIILTKAGFDSNQPRAADGQWGKVSGDIKLEDRPCFKEWFGDSKIVNEDGKPKKVYHGGIGEIEEFDDRYAGDTTGNNEHGAFYFSDDYEVAESYSIQAFNRRYQDNPEGLIEDGYVKELPFEIGDYDEQYAFVEELANDNVNIVSAYMRMENPLIIDADYTTMLRGGVTENIQDIIGVIKGTGFENYPKLLLDYTYDEIDSFDGIIIKNVMDDIGPKSKVYQDVHIAIDSNQIKSVDAKSFCDETNINKSLKIN